MASAPPNFIHFSQDNTVTTNIRYTYVDVIDSQKDMDGMQTKPYLI